MRSIISPLYLLLMLLVFDSCSRNTVNLSYTNAKDEVPVLGNLVFRFNQSIAPDSLLNQWDSSVLVSFDPAIQGRFRWERPDQLVFSPAGPLKPATSYKASVNNSVLQHTDFNDITGADKIQFHTPDLRLDNSQAFWAGETAATVVPQIDLYFNFPVAPDELKDKLRIEVDGKPVNYNLVTAEPAEKISLTLMDLKPEDKDHSAGIVVEKGIKPEKGINRTAETMKQSLIIPSPYVLTIQNMEMSHDGMEGTVQVFTSQQPENESLKSFIKIDPGLSYTVSSNERGLVIRSENFDVEKSYMISIAKGLKGRIGGVLKEEYSGGVAFGELEANISFTNTKAVYLSGKGNRNIEVRITNVARVKLVVSKIYENNLLHAGRYGYYPQETRSAPGSYGEEEYGYYGDEGYADAVLGDVIYEKEIDAASLPKNGAARLLNFSDFEDRLPEFKGIYHVLIRSTEDYWVRDSRYLSVSDLGLVAKEGHDRVFVFVNSIQSAIPAKDVNIALYSTNNQLIGMGSTNAEGAVEIAFSRNEIAGFKPAMVIAKTADDFNYLPFHTTRVNTSRFEVGGRRTNATGLDAFIYGERDIYRPGEKINYSVIVRDRLWKVPGDMPVKIKMLMPNGREWRTVRKNLNEEGSVEGSFDISSSAITGTYTMEVYTFNDILLASSPISVEEFVPDRIRVDAKLDKKMLQPGEAAQLSIQADNFFGPPAALRNYETEIQVKQKAFAPAKFPTYDFALANQRSFFDKIVLEGKTNESGQAIEKYQVPAQYSNLGLLLANFYATVFDETGRPVSRMVSADIFTQDHFYGIRREDFNYYPLNQAIQFPLVSVNKEGNSASSTARVVVIKQEYRTVLARSGSYFRYDSRKEEKLVTEQQMNIGANTIYSFVPRSPGDYELRIYRPGSNNYVARSFYSYGSWGAASSSFEVNTEGNIEIELDKNTYEPGGKVKALFKTPFSGKMLVTLETDRVLSHQYVDVSSRNAQIELPLTEEHVPNVYLTATLIKPHDVSDIPLTVAHGFRSVSVEEKSRKIAVEIVADEKVRSSGMQQVKVKAEPNSYVTLAAVDNGVLQVSNFKTPDPYGFFYSKKALQVIGYDMFPLLFAEIRARMSSTGGDGELSMEKRVNPMPAKRVKILSFWSGIKKIGSNGEAVFNVEIPKFSGQIRLMAVAYKSRSFGSGEKAMTVADPLVISAALPRFLSPGDSLLLPVTISNTTSKNASVVASIQAEGAVIIPGEKSIMQQVNANSEGRFVFNLAGKNDMGVGKMRINVSGLGEKFEDIQEISVRPASTLQKRSGSGVITGSNSQKINFEAGDFIPGSNSYELVVSNSPALEWGEHLRYLVQYPYGCSEQIISVAFPQLYFGEMADLLKAGDPNSRQKKENAVSNILEAVRLIKMRQLYNGAITLWDGGGTEDWWTTVYAAHFLLEAKGAGYEVDNSLIETMLGYLSFRLRKKELTTYYYNRDQNRKIAPKEVAYSLYVLSLAGRSNVSAMNYYKATPDVLALDSRYLLSAAYAKAGDKKSYSAILPSSFSGEESIAQSGGSFYSDLRDEAISLNVLLDVDPSHPQIPVMAKHVSDKLKSRQYMSTQERAFGFLALGKLARMAGSAESVAEILVNGKSISRVEKGIWKSDRASLRGDNGKSPTVEIRVRGNGNMYYMWEAEGISRSGDYVEEDSYLKVRKRFFEFLND